MDRSTLVIEKAAFKINKGEKKLLILPYVNSNKNSIQTISLFSRLNVFFGMEQSHLILFNIIDLINGMHRVLLWMGGGGEEMGMQYILSNFNN